MTQDALKVANREQLGEKTDWFPLLALELASQASRTSDLQRCTNAPGVLIQFIGNAKAGSPTFTPKILVPDAAGGADITLVTFTAISSSGNSLIVLHPAAADMGSEDKIGTLPRDWKLTLTYTGADTSHNMDTAVYARYI